MSSFSLTITKNAIKQMTTEYFHLVQKKYINRYISAAFPKLVVYFNAYNHRKGNERMSLPHKKTQVCKCNLLLPQIKILIFKTRLKTETKISHDFISVSCVKTLIRALLDWLTE